MNSAFRITETLYIETSHNNVFALIPAGRTVPATWEQTFSTSVENQRSFDMHLLRGNTPNLWDSTSLGKWRIGGIPAAPIGEHRINAVIRVGIDGSVGLRATLNDQPLPVTLLTEAFPKIPLTFRVPTIPLEKQIDQQCPQCKHNFIIRSTNWKQEPFALCLDCGHKFNLPDTISSRGSAPWDDLPPELMNTMGIESPHTPGGLSPEEIEELEAQGFDFFIKEKPDLNIGVDNIIQQIPGMMFRQNKPDELTPDDIIRMAGDPLPEDKRRNCPKCDAVISLDAKRCEWCGQIL